jgi:hypothetical protein
MNTRKPLIITFCAFAVFAGAGSLTAQSTDPGVFTTFTESVLGKAGISLTQLHAEVDSRSVIQITFEENRMKPPSNAAGNEEVKIRVEAFLVEGTTVTPVTIIDNYLSGTVSAPVRHDKSFRNLPGFAVIPDTSIDLGALNAADYDKIQIRVTNLITQESVERHLVPRSFGFHTSMSDSMLFVKRQGVTNEEEDAGLEDFNFGPAPGVTYLASFLPRRNGFLRLLRPGIGLNVSFMDWDDSAFDPASGMFPQGTDSNDIEVGMGLQLSFFNNVLQVTYGWNLQAEQDREYFGVGLSFVNLTQSLRRLITQ